jgi:hypothetical protein
MALVLVAAVHVLQAVGHPADPIALPFEVVAGVRQLFLDTAGIATSANLAQTMHSPRKKGAVIRPRMLDDNANRASLHWLAFCVWDCAEV